ncbi:bifunctional (p)ppGpp synthetase/guanosine-3',5'-bis(diphosphate) 3'-pyrophosphohydrolase [Leucobacter sp. OH1287]|uniref:RelA/SpoT family protein n=1 Tax=Leucobacter sp. OH1287 TaxID=2491049 RepID=UPI000F5EAA56|nr:bifunctional (p)ppGpp synthetase/guanosine-3',5'-bis(diphosphate) 3'-pyrophosphohydrolase [Leucobacter sp. OH1287]RRD61849.1 bifunctional (p)ppGpp synthetase/guanosine-3',5'-bis(diphosphate) 3'-pyrophosphohydrolase [Leucobacter sp. OH1287]
MTEFEQSNGSSTLRRLMPRVFARASAPDCLSKLLRTVRGNHPKSDLSIITEAYRVAEHAHRDQTRRSGEPYITHPIAVAQILADLGVTPPVVAAALLHDTVEDTDYTLEELTEQFGDEIALLVDGVTKLDKVQYGDSAQAETVRKMIVAMTKDIRVLVIKLADRLHNARTWGFMPQEKAKSKAQETLEIYAPLAHRLGIQPIKTELEDLSFAVLKPKLYTEIENLVNRRSPKREELVRTVTDAIEEDLRETRVRGTVSGRPKELYSIYQKMVVRGRDFDDIYDLVGIRVIVESIRDCYAVLGAVHARWTPIPGRFKDYIATPKFNLYQSLHTTVIGPEGKAVEIQIRTTEMHQRAEYGVAAHWKYKQRAKDGSPAKVATKSSEMAWLSHINDWQAETEDPGEFLDALRYEIGAKEVYVFTPKGRVIGLPAKATPVDFAYAVHTDVGHRTMGARVNERMVSLATELVTGDVVEIFTSNDPNAGPKKHWLNFVKSRRAQNKIRNWFTKERRADAAERGKELMLKELRKQQLPVHRIMQSEALQQVVLQLHYVDIEGLYAGIGENKVSAQSVVEKISTLLDKAYGDASESVDHSIPAASSSQQPSSDSGVTVIGASDVLVKLAKCCTPVPGDEIKGFVTKGMGVSVHRTDCKNFQTLMQATERLTDVQWAPNAKSVFLVHIQVEALDRARLLSDVTNALSEQHVNILSASLHTSNQRLAISRFTFEMANATHLEQVLNAVRRVDGVYDAYRVNSL